MAIKVLVSGTGKMGRESLAAVCREPDLEPVGVLSRSAGGEKQSPPARARRPSPTPGRPPPVPRGARGAGPCLVIGPSGLSDAFLKELAGECLQRQLAAVV